MQKLKFIVSVAFGVACAFLCANPVLATSQTAHISAGSDDAREILTNGAVKLDSSDLNVVVNPDPSKGVQYIGLRFQSLAIPQGATIAAAYIQFTSFSGTVDAASITIKAQATNTAPAFSTAGYNISSRATTTASVTWNPPSWPDVDVAGPDQQTANLTELVQEVVNRADWTSGNSMAFIFSGSGNRNVWSFEGGNSTNTAALHLTWWAPTITADAGPNGSIDPSGAIELAMNGSQAFSITPDSGYEISDVVVDDSSIGPTNGYAFSNVVSNHTISVLFKIAGAVVIPYSNSFEAYPSGYIITNQSAWHTGRDTDIAVVTNMATDKTSPYFPTNEPDTKTLSVLGLASCGFQKNLDLDLVYVDVLVYPGCREDPPTIVNPKPQLAVYVDSNEHLVIYHSYYSEETEEPGGYAKTWVTNTVDTVPSNRWTRLTFTFAYSGEPGWYNAYFCVQVNGGARFAYELGYASTSDDNYTPDYGPWLMVADLPYSAPGGFVSSFGVSGSCCIDDLAVSDSLPPVAPGARTSHGTPLPWLLTYYPDTPPESYETQDTNDSDGDCMPTWEEYWAGTDPTNTDSKFAIIQFGSDWSVKWFGGTNEENLPFQVWRSTNLVNPASWDWYTNCSRTNGMTNVWIDTDASNYAKLFYKITTPTNYP